MSDEMRLVNLRPAIGRHLAQILDVHFKKHGHSARTSADIQTSIAEALSYFLALQIAMQAPDEKVFQSQADILHGLIDDQLEHIYNNKENILNDIVGQHDCEKCDKKTECNKQKEKVKEFKKCEETEVRKSNGLWN